MKVSVITLAAREVLRLMGQVERIAYSDDLIALRSGDITEWGQLPSGTI